VAERIVVIPRSAVVRPDDLARMAASARLLDLALPPADELARLADGPDGESGLAGR
jgi:hypothetical protein